MKSARSQQFGQIRARIEATFSSPALLTVTSAARGDGKTVTAFGIAESLAQAHHRVLLIDTNVETPTLARIHHLPASAHLGNVSDISRFALPVAAQRFEGVSFADQRFESGMSMENIRSAVANVRAHFDFIIVDTGRLIRSDLAVLFATVADGTLLTLRLGRLPTQADEETMQTLNRVGASVLGLMTVAPAMIKAFVGAREDVIPTIRVPARHVTTHHSIGPEPAREAAVSESKFM